MTGTATTGQTNGCLIPADGMFSVILPASITPEQWQKIHDGMATRHRGYASVAATQSALQCLAANGVVPAAHKDWVDSLIYALRLTCKPNIDLQAQEQAQQALSDATAACGTTTDLLKGGFVLTDGRFLDMSLGTKERCLDHCHVDRFFKPRRACHLLAIDEWKDLGLIRWISEGRGISMRTQPTPNQFATIRRMVCYRPDKSFHLDVYDFRYKATARSYPPGISADKVIVDIERFYEAGVMGAMSRMMAMHLTPETARLYP